MNIFCIKVFIVLHMTGFFLESSCTEITYSSLHINSTLKNLCTSPSSFKTSLSNFISVKSQLTTRPYQIVLLNEASLCKNNVPDQSTVHLSVSINYPSPDDATQNLELLEKVTKWLKEGINIGNFQVITATLITPSATKVSISSKTLYIIIGAVLAVYMFGYICVITTQSDSYNETDAPKAYAVSTVNKVFKERKIIDDVQTVGDKHT